MRIPRWPVPRAALQASIGRHDFKESFPGSPASRRSRIRSPPPRPTPGKMPLRCLPHDAVSVGVLRTPGDDQGRPRGCPHSSGESPPRRMGTPAGHFSELTRLRQGPAGQRCGLSASRRGPDTAPRLSRDTLSAGYSDPSTARGRRAAQRILPVVFLCALGALSGGSASVATAS